MKTITHDQPAEPLAPATADASAPKKRRRRNERNAALYDDEIFELLQAIDGWRRKSHRSFPAWSEVIQLLKGLGWRKVAPPTPGADGTAAASAAPAVALPIEPVEPVEPAKPRAA